MRFSFGEKSSNNHLSNESPSHNYCSRGCGRISENNFSIEVGPLCLEVRPLDAVALSTTSLLLTSPSRRILVIPPATNNRLFRPLQFLADIHRVRGIRKISPIGNLICHFLCCSSFKYFERCAAVRSKQRRPDELAGISPPLGQPLQRL